MNAISVLGAGDHEQKPGALPGKGGEGAVFALRQHPDLVVKYYHPEVWAEHGHRLRVKIDAQITLYPKLKHLPLARPRLAVYDGQKRWIGYAMASAEGMPIRNMAHAILQRNHLPQLGRMHIARCLIRLLSTIEALHRRGVILGDINLSNLLPDEVQFGVVNSAALSRIAVMSDGTAERLVNLVNGEIAGQLGSFMAQARRNHLDAPILHQFLAHADTWHKNTRGRACAGAPDCDSRCRIVTPLSCPRLNRGKPMFTGMQAIFQSALLLPAATAKQQAGSTP